MVELIHEAIYEATAGLADEVTVGLMIELMVGMTFAYMVESIH